jgi:hypothetical protein
MGDLSIFCITPQVRQLSVYSRFPPIFNFCELLISAKVKHSADFPTEALKEGKNFFKKPFFIYELFVNKTAFYLYYRTIVGKIAQGVVQIAQRGA